MSVGIKTSCASDDIAQVLRVLNTIKCAKKWISTAFQTGQEMIGVSIGKIISFKTDVGFNPLIFAEKSIFREDPELDSMCLCFPNAFFKDPL
jgi:hypothetical protein